MRIVRRIATITLLVSAMILPGCNPDGTDDPVSINLGGTAQMRLKMEISPALGVDSGTVTISKGDLVYSRPLEFEDDTTTVLFADLQPGIWLIAVELRDADGFVLYDGGGSAEVLDGQVATAHIVLTELVGALEVVVELPTDSFTLVILPDTQYYSQTHHDVFHAQTQWIVDSVVDRRIVYVAHLGDIVEHGDNGGDDSEWQVADAAMSRLETVLPPDGIPFGQAVGNHDQTPGGNPDGATVFYNQYFGESRFSGRAYYGGHYGENNDNHYALFSAGGLDFIVVFFEFDHTPDQSILDWAHGLLLDHSGRHAVVVTHYLMGTGNPGNFSSQGQAIYDTLKECPNLFLMLGGHVNGEGYRQDTYQGHTVHSLLSDYQFHQDLGYLRIMEFSPADDEIRVMTYSPYIDSWQTGVDSEFTLSYEMGGVPCP